MKKQNQEQWQAAATAHARSRTKFMKVEKYIEQRLDREVNCWLRQFCQCVDIAGNSDWVQH